MPVVKRLVEPIHCSRAPIPKGVKNDLEAVCINTLSSVILQLSSVAKHAEGIFAEIFTEANNLHVRTCNVQQRLDQLAIAATKLDSAGEEISLQEINMTKPFKMTVHSDQQVLSRQTLPEAMMESYARCHPVPNLALLTKYRHDGKDALKFYTDPSYFFELWKQKMNVEFEKRRKKKKREQRDKKRETEKKEVKGVKKKVLKKNIPDWEIQDHQERKSSMPTDPTPINVDEDVAPRQHSGSIKGSLSPRSLAAKRGSTASVIGRPLAAPPPPPTASPSKPPPPPPVFQDSKSITKPSSMPPPPPPPPPSATGGEEASVPYGVPPPPPPPPTVGGPPGPPPPPPPPPLSGGVPPPPPPAPPVAPPPPSAADLTSGIKGVVLSAPKPAPPPVADSRNDLLTAIRDGMNLRKAVQITKDEKQEIGMGNDVATILSRRIALEYSDSEDDSEFSDEGEWSDE